MSDKNITGDLYQDLAKAVEEKNTLIKWQVAEDFLRVASEVCFMGASSISELVEIVQKNDDAAAKTKASIGIIGAGLRAFGTIPKIVVNVYDPNPVHLGLMYSLVNGMGQAGYENVAQNVTFLKARKNFKDFEQAFDHLKMLENLDLISTRKVVKDVINFLSQLRLSLKKLKHLTKLNAHHKALTAVEDALTKIEVFNQALTKIDEAIEKNEDADNLKENAIKKLDEAIGACEKVKTLVNTLLQTQEERNKTPVKK